MKFTIEDQKTGKAVKLNLQKTTRNKSIALMNVETTEKILEVSSAGGQMAVAINDSVAEQVSMGSIMSPETIKPADREKLRNWRTEGKTMIFNNPKQGYELELAMAAKPGSMCPEHEVSDILGQPDMTFAVAFALKTGRHSMLVGPTGTGKTSTYRWFAKQLGWNFVLAPIARGTESSHLVGDYLPVGQALFEWMDGPVTEAIRLSQQGPTILVFDEINRIGNIAELSRIYSVLDDTRMLELKEKRDSKGIAERLEVGELYIGATANPSDDESADYMGVQDLDPALSSRFSLQPTVSYPPVEVELEALIDRVPGIDKSVALKMVSAAKRIRDAADIRFPISFRELENWAVGYEAFGYDGAARVAVINKAPRIFHQSIENLLKVM